MSKKKIKDELLKEIDQLNLKLKNSENEFGQARDKLRKAEIAKEKALNDLKTEKTRTSQKLNVMEKKFQEQTNKLFIVN